MSHHHNNGLTKDHRLEIAMTLLAGMLAGKASTLESNDKQLVIRAVRMADWLADAVVKMPVHRAEEERAHAD